MFSPTGLFSLYFYALPSFGICWKLSGKAFDLYVASLKFSQAVMYLSFFFAKSEARSASVYIRVFKIAGKTWRSLVKFYEWPIR